jgi:sialidase-1
MPTAWQAKLNDEQYKNFHPHSNNKQPRPFNTRNMNLSISILTLSILLCTTAQSQTLDFIKAGKMLNVTQENRYWREKDGAALGRGKQSALYASKYIEAGDFTMKVKISLEEINKSEACFWFFHNQFGFDSNYNDDQDYNKLFTYSPVSDEYAYYGNSSDYFNAGEVFDFEVRHRGKETQFLINQKLVTTIPDSLLKSPYAGSMAFRAERNTLRIYDWTFEGKWSEVPQQDYVFQRGEAGYSCFRIPAIVQTKEGTLLAFAEGRQLSCEDNGDVDIVMKRSADGGLSWSDLEVVWADSSNTCSYPAPMVDPISGKIILLSVWQNGQDHYEAIFAGKSLDSRRIFHQESVDQGVSWSIPQEITSSVKKENWTYYGLGYTSLIQLQKGPKAGRLLLSAYHGKDGTDSMYVHLIYSDDLGLSWHLGGICPTAGINETEIAELPDGTIYLLIRNDKSFERQRKVAYSKDQGASISAAVALANLDGVICQTSLLTVPTKEATFGLLQSSPANNYARERLVLRWSEDEGRNWKEVEEIHRSYAAYSDLIQLADGKVASLFEGGSLFQYQGIAFRFLNWKP